MNPEIFSGGNMPERDTGSSRRMTVSDFTRVVKRLIEDGIGTVVVEGEISNFIHHSSGHRYFTLKDDFSQLRCVMFKWQVHGLSCVPTDGMHVVAVGQAAVYERGGQYQLTVVRLTEQGKGTLFARLEELKRRLAEEGVFANERPIPSYPSVVGVATSPTGAAVRDIMTVIGRRAPHVRIILRPTLVQGADATADIVGAIQELNEYTDADVIIVGRGGGSIEDLWAFNEEAVARAIADSRIRVISAVGHETDVTLADFAADLRAPTPSAAAELAVKDAAETKEYIAALTGRMRRAVTVAVDSLTRRVDAVKRGLRSERMLGYFASRGQTVDEMSLRLKGAATDFLSDRHRRLERLSGKLAALDPHAVLERGYAIVYREDDGRIVKDGKMVSAGDGVRVKLSRGGFAADVRGSADV